MKVIYAKTITERISEARYAASIINKEIECIELNNAESDKLRAELNMDSKIDELTLFGIKIILVCRPADHFMDAARFRVTK